MKYSALLFIIGLIFTSNNLYSQTKTIIDLPKRFKVGDMYYASNCNGLKLLMSDLQHENPSLHAKLSPSYLNLKNKKEQAIIMWAAGGIIGTSLIIGGVTFLQKEEVDYQPNHPFYDPHVKRPNVAVIGSGIGVYLITGIIGAIICPNDNDIYQFINLHNKHNHQQKMDWQIGLHLIQDKKLGLKLTMNF